MFCTTPRKSGRAIRGSPTQSGDGRLLVNAHGFEGAGPCIELKDRLECCAAKFGHRASTEWARERPETATNRAGNTCRDDAALTGAAPRFIIDGGRSRSDAVRASGYPSRSEGGPRRHAPGWCRAHLHQAVSGHGPRPPGPAARSGAQQEMSARGI